MHAVCANLATALTTYVEPRGLGLVFGQDSGFVLAQNPDTVRATDVAFVRRERASEIGIPAGYWPEAPDLAVEVVSPADRRRDFEAKCRAYLASGSRLVWLVDPPCQEPTARRRLLTATRGNPLYCARERRCGKGVDRFPPPR
jgi:Uma2 family endonuclease